MTFTLRDMKVSWLKEHLFSLYIIQKLEDRAFGQVNHLNKIL